MGHLKSKVCYNSDDDLKIPVPCHICAEFVPKSESQLHGIQEHEVKESLICNECDPPRTFKQFSERASHQRLVHDKSYGFECDECGQGFKWRQYLDNHNSLKSIARSQGAGPARGLPQRSVERR